MSILRIDDIHSLTQQELNNKLDETYQNLSYNDNVVLTTMDPMMRGQYPEFTNWKSLQQLQSLGESLGCFTTYIGVDIPYKSFKWIGKRYKGLKV